MIDLRSEIVIPPSPGMRKAISSAQTGADLFGEDKSVSLLEQRVAKLLGKDSAIFLPTVTMGNLIALKLWGRSGDEALVEARSHIFCGEMAGISAVCGMLAHPLRGDPTGLPQWEDIRFAIRGRTSTRAETSVLCLENTHNFAGGRVPDTERMLDVCQRTRNCGLKTHLDGARLFNACVATGCEPSQIARGFDSVVVSFSKGLGAPAGAALAIKSEFIAEARRYRRMLGGGLNQPGFLAAACLYALDENYSQLQEDHRRARVLGKALSLVRWAATDITSIQTNILIFSPVPHDAGPQIITALKAHGLFAYPLDDGRIRLVTHLGFSDEMLQRAITIVQGLHVNSF